MANNIRKISGSVNGTEIVECKSSLYHYSGPVIEITTVLSYELELNKRYLVSYCYYGGMGSIYGRLNVVPFFFDGNTVYDSGYIDYTGVSSSSYEANIQIINNSNGTISFRIDDGSGAYAPNAPVTEESVLIKLNDPPRILS